MVKEYNDPKLQRIANILMLNASFVDNLGLLYGKMGITIFLFHYAKYARNEVYEIYAGLLLDEIYEEISKRTSIDFTNGLTGIGWGIEYLVRNGFVEADTDEVLNEIDNTIFQTLIDAPISIQNQTDLFGYGLYYLSRLKGRENNNDDIKTLIKKQILIQIMDECQGLLTKGSWYYIVLPKLSMYQVNSIAWFILQTRMLNLFPVKNDKLVLHLADYVENKMEKSFCYSDCKIFRNIMSRIMELMTDSNSKKKIEKILDQLLISSLDSFNEDQLINEFTKSWYNPILYDNYLGNYRFELADKAVKLIDTEELWKLRIESINSNNLGLVSGMAGLGFTLLRDAEILMTKTN